MLIAVPLVCLGLLALCAVASRWHHAGSRPGTLDPLLRWLHRRLARGWAVPGLAVIAGSAFPPGWRLGNHDVPTLAPLPPVRAVFVAHPAFGPFTLGVLARRHGDDEVPELGGAEWALSPSSHGLPCALAVAWAGWCVHGDPALPIPKGWRLQPGDGDRVQLLAGDGLEVRDVTYAIALPFAFEQAHFLRRWRLLLRVSVSSCVALLALNLVINLLAFGP